jgi:beta-glucanase (GH16 family)
MKSTTFFLFTASLAASVNCQVKTTGLANGRDANVGAGGSGLSASGGRAGTGGQGPDSFPGFIADDAGGSPATVDAFASTADVGGAAGLGAGGVGGLAGNVVDAPAVGGMVNIDGASETKQPGTGGGGTGGGTGSGGMSGTGGSTSGGGTTGTNETTVLDGAIDVTPVQIVDSSPELGPDAPVVPDDGGPASPDRPEVLVDTRDAVEAPAPDLGPTYTLVWSDEFNGAANTGVDTGKWTYVNWAPGHVNSEKQQYTSSLNNVFQDGYGNLVIRGLYSPMSMTPYTSGRIDTSGSASWGPGHRIEVRAKLPAGTGSFPGIIMMGTTGVWPQSGELAILEQYGQDKSWFYSSATAGSGANAGTTGNVKYTFPDATTASTDYHIYSVDWYTDHLVFEVDGYVIVSSNFGTTSAFHSITEYLVLDVALGGTMGGTIDNTDFPMDMIVDYVRVYSF